MSKKWSLKPGTLFVFTGVNDRFIPAYSTPDSNITDDCVGHITPEDVVLITCVGDDRNDDGYGDFSTSFKCWHRLVTKDIIGWVKYIRPIDVNIIDGV